MPPKRTVANKMSAKDSSTPSLDAAEQSTSSEASDGSLNRRERYERRARFAEAAGQEKALMVSSKRGRDAAEERGSSPSLRFKPVVRKLVSNENDGLFKDLS